MSEQGERLPDDAGVALVRGSVYALLAFVCTLPAAMLAVASRGWIALVVAAAIAAAAVRLRGAGRVAAFVAAAGVALGACWGALAYHSVTQDSGGLTVAMTDPFVLGGPGVEYRRGQGQMLIDLRRMRQPQRGARLRMQLTSDTDNVVVALPERQCWRVVLHHRRIPLRPWIFDRLAWPLGLHTAAAVPPETHFPAGLGTAEQYRYQSDRDRQGTADVIAYGLPVFDDDGTWVRGASEAGAPTLTLDVESGGQVVLRNYPPEVRLAPANFIEAAWPGGETPAEVAELPHGASWQGDRGGRPRLKMPDGRDVTDAYVRQKVREASAIARHLAGPCATRSELVSRRVEVVELESAFNRLGSTDAVYVDGLGRVLRVRRGSDGLDWTVIG